MAETEGTVSDADFERFAVALDTDEAHLLRWEFPKMTGAQIYRSMACAMCGVRRDEHADQNLPYEFSMLNITEHPYGEPK